MRALVLASTLLAAGTVLAVEEHLEIRAAQLELKLARAHLQNAGRDYEGHRRAAVERVNQALEEIRLALKGARAAGKVEPEGD